MLLELRACSEVAAHAPTLDGDVAPAFREEPVDELHHERDAFGVHLTAPVAHIARCHKGVEHVELAHILHVHAERLCDGHDELVPLRRFCFIVRVDGEVAAVHLAHQLLHIVQHRNFDGTVLHGATGETAVHLEDISEGIPEVLILGDRAVLRDVEQLTRLAVVAHMHVPGGELVALKHGEHVVAGDDGAELVVLGDGDATSAVALRDAGGMDAGEIEAVDGGQMHLPVVKTYC